MIWYLPIIETAGTLVRTRYLSLQRSSGRFTRLMSKIKNGYLITGEISASNLSAKCG